MWHLSTYVLWKCKAFLQGMENKRPGTAESEPRQYWLIWPLPSSCSIWKHISIQYLIFHFVSPILDIKFFNHLPLMLCNLKATQTCLIYKIFITPVSYHLIIVICKGFCPSGYQNGFYFHLQVLFALTVFVSRCTLPLVTGGRSWQTGKFCNTIKTTRLGLRLFLAVDQNCFYLQLSGTSFRAGWAASSPGFQLVRVLMNEEGDPVCVTRSELVCTKLGWETKQELHVHRHTSMLITNWW